MALADHVHILDVIQIFHTLYHSDENVLLGAPTGSGKTISAELAILHTFTTQPGRKVIYIAPLKVHCFSKWHRRHVALHITTLVSGSLHVHTPH
jgi:ERCC4-related helicase